MTMDIQPTYQDQVYHLTVWFRKPSKANYVGPWAVEWVEMMDMLKDWIASFTQDTFGILSVNITKTDPTSNYIFVAYITYWLHP